MDGKNKLELLTRKINELQKENKQLQGLLKNSRDVLYRMSLPDGAYEYVSPGSTELFGYSPEEFYESPKLVGKIIHPAWQDYFQQQWAQLLGCKMPPTYEFQIIHNITGETRWIFQKNVLIRDESGNPVAIEGIVSDITERKKVEDALRISENSLKEAQEMARLGYWYWDVKTGDVKWSDQVYDIFHLDPKEFKPQIDSVMSLSPWPENRDIHEKLLQRAIERHEKGTYEQKFLYPDGSTGYYFSTFQGVFDDDGNLFAMKGTVQDITERKRAENAHRSSEARFKDLVEMLPEAVFETDLNFDLVFVNQRALEIFGYSREEFDRGLNGLDMIAPEDLSRLKENHARRLRGEKVGTIEYQALKKDGTRFPVLFHASLIRKDGETVGSRGIIVDISDQKQAEKEKEQLEEQYRQAQKVESIGRLAGGVAHDFNNLLMPILGYSELLMGEFASDDRRKGLLGEVVSAGLRAKELVGQLLAFGRKQTLEYRVLDMNNILKGIEKLLRRTIRENIDINLIPSTVPQTIRADAVQIEQVILNLAVNSQDAMPNCGTLTIETERVKLDSSYAKDHFDSEPGNYVLLSISDTGFGMDEKTREQIFEPFFSTKGELGTGLGLATVYGIVKQHGGNVSVDSEPGKGTVFKVYLPFFEGKDAPESIIKKTDEDLCGSETILLVEDNESVRRLAREILKHHGFVVLEAENGEQALKVIETHKGPIELLLADVIMPGMNGRELYDKAAEIRHGLKVLYMSGYTDDIIAHHGILEKGVEFIQKPFSPHTLVTKIRSVLASLL